MFKTIEISRNAKMIYMLEMSVDLLPGLKGHV